MKNTTPYARFPGEVIAAPPCKMFNANMYGFFLQGDYDRIQAYLDQTVNLAAPGTDTFKALTSYCMLTFTDIEKITAVTEPYASQGWFQETDVIIWIPVAQMRGTSIIHIFWYPGFICVNNVYALVNGRETWGFNKYLCQCDMPAIGGSPDFFNITVDAFKAFSPDTQLLPTELFQVASKGAVQEKPLSGIKDLVQAGFHVLKDQPNGLHLDWRLLLQLIDGLLHPQVDQLLFKQFPDGEDKNAVYQQVLHSPSVVQKVHSIKLYTHAFEFVLNKVDMFPLDTMFGIQVGSQQPLLSFNVLFDFNQDAAFVVAP